MKWRWLPFRFLILTVVLVSPWVAQGEMILQHNYSGSPHSFDSLLDRRANAPQRFDHHHPWLGRVLIRGEGLREFEAAGIDPLGLFPDSRKFNALHARRELNPNRFDTFHPILGVLLGEDLRLRNWTPPLPEVPFDPSTLPTAPPTDPWNPPSNGPPFLDDPKPSITPHPVPEPATAGMLLLGGLLAGAAAWLRRGKAGTTHQANRPVPSNCRKG